MSSIREGMQVLLFLLGLFLILGTVGRIEMTDTIHWTEVVGQAALGFLLMWYGAKGVNKID